jgi:hypothetical protein
MNHQRTSINGGVSNIGRIATENEMYSKDFVALVGTWKGDIDVAIPKIYQPG